MWFLVKQLSPKIHVLGRIENFSAGVVRLQLNLLKLNTLVNIIGCAHAYAYGLYLENVGSNQKKLELWILSTGLGDCLWFLSKRACISEDFFGARDLIS